MSAIRKIDVRVRRRPIRVYASALGFAIAVLLCRCTLPAQNTPPSDREVEAFAQRARSEQSMGKEVPIPKQLSHELTVGVSAAEFNCHPEDPNILEAHRTPLGSSQPDVLVIQGQGGCFCSPTGNCEFWIYEIKGGKIRAILKRGSVQTFGFLKSRTHGYPDLITWTHGSATDHGARLFRFDGIRYAASGGWEEETEYLDSKGKLVETDKPRITSHFSRQDQIPNEVNP